MSRFKYRDDEFEKILINNLLSGEKNTEVSRKYSQIIHKEKHYLKYLKKYKQIYHLKDEEKKLYKILEMQQYRKDIELNKMLAFFDEKNIKTIILKSESVEKTNKLYSNDIDIYIDYKDKIFIKDYLVSQGYKKIKRKFNATNITQIEYIKNNISYDIHYRLYGLRLKYENFTKNWDHSVQYKNYKYARKLGRKENFEYTLFCILKDGCQYNHHFYYLGLDKEKKWVETAEKIQKNYFNRKFKIVRVIKNYLAM